MLKRSFWLVLTISICFLGYSVTRAQSNIKATIKDLNASSFPMLSLYLDVHNEDGEFIHGLQTSDIQIIEDKQSVQTAHVSELRPGVMLTVAMNPGKSFTIRNSQGYSRYDLILETLVNWSRIRLGSTIDDLSITVANGPERTHITNPFELFYTLSDYQLTEQSAEPSLDVLFKAVEITSDPAPRMAMERVILFITSPLKGDLSFTIQNLLAQSSQKNIHIFVWFITSQETFDPKSAYSLTELADQTGGAFFTFTGIESLPSLEDYLEPQRSIYQLSYQSLLKSGGQHQIAAEINPGLTAIRTPAIEFEINLQPPNPAFIAPLLKIERKPVQSENQKESDHPFVLLPASQKMQILVDFPDGRARNITHSALYVDGALVDENQKTPFDQFSWDLNRYEQSGQHLLQAEVTDNLGLTGKTIVTPVIIEVYQPPSAYLEKLSPYLPTLIALFMVVAIALSLLILILSGKIQPKSPFKPRKRGRISSEVNRTTNPPRASLKSWNVAAIKPTTSWMSRWLRPERQAIPLASAYLTRIAEEGETPDIVAITSDELTIGSDPNRASVLVDDPSVEELHARLVKLPDNSYHIYNESAIAGTWVNFEPVPDGGVTLNQSDQIHIGKICFRFTLREPPPQAEPLVFYEESK